MFRRLLNSASNQLPFRRPPAFRLARNHIPQPTTLPHIPPAITLPRPNFNFPCPIPPFQPTSPIFSHGRSFTTAFESYEVPFPDPNRPPDKPAIKCRLCPEVEFRSYQDLEKHCKDKAKKDAKDDTKTDDERHHCHEFCTNCRNGLPEKKGIAHVCLDTVDLMRLWSATFRKKGGRKKGGGKRRGRSGRRGGK